MAELKEQKYMLEIAKVQGIGKAAENLFISQPALSKFLARTEEMYGIQLFERVGKKMIPTYAGEQYLKYAKQMIEIDRNFNEQIKDIKQMKSGVLAIGSTLGRGKDIFPSLLPLFYKKYPGFELRVYQENAVRLEELLRNGEIQLAMLTIEDGEQNKWDFHAEELDSEEICLIAPKNWNLKGVMKYGFRHPWIDVRQLEEELFLMLNKGSRLRSVADKMMKSYNMSPKSMEFSSIDTIWKLVSQNFGVAFASDFNAPPVDDVEIFSVGSKPITWKFVILTRIGGYISAPVQYMIDITKNIYGNVTFQNRVSS